jgi:hypothetical protein
MMSFGKWGLHFGKGEGHFFSQSEKLRWKLLLTVTAVRGSNLPLLPVIFTLPGNYPVIFLLFYITAVIIFQLGRGN